MNRIEFTSHAAKQLSKMDKSTQRKIAEAIGTLIIPDLTADLQIKKLQSPQECYRLRTGDYRILFEKETDKILIHHIGHRKDVYR
jgi:mRNA interferase RelE/StbE